MDLKTIYIYVFVNMIQVLFYSSQIGSLLFKTLPMLHLTKNGILKQYSS